MIKLLDDSTHIGLRSFCNCRFMDLDKAERLLVTKLHSRSLCLCSYPIYLDFSHISLTATSAENLKSEFLIHFVGVGKNQNLWMAGPIR